MARVMELDGAIKGGALDLRVNRTRELLIEAFVELCGEKGIQAVSVADIARRAGVNRATFYRHFEGKSDLTERGIELLLSALFETIENLSLAGAAAEDRILMRITCFFEIARDRSKLFRLLISGAASPVFLEKMETFVDSFLRERRLGIVGEGKLMLPLPLASRGLTALLFGFTYWWMDHPRLYTARQMAILFLRTTTQGFFKDDERA